MAEEKNKGGRPPKPKQFKGPFRKRWVKVTKVKDSIWEAKCTYPKCPWKETHGSWTKAASSGIFHKHDD